MCNDEKLLKYQLQTKKKAKYEIEIGRASCRERV